MIKYWLLFVNSQCIASRIKALRIVLVFFILLVQRLEGFINKPKKTFIVHEKEETSQEISKKIERELNISTYILELGEDLIIEGEKGTPKEKITLKERNKQYNEIEKSLEKLKSSLYPVLKKLEQKSEKGKENGELAEIKNRLIRLQKESAELKNAINP